MTDTDPFVTVTLSGLPASFPLARLATIRIGRAPDATVVLVDQLASRDHATIRREAGGRCVLSDSGSRNGTTLNRRPVTHPVVLADGDRIRVGGHELVFHQPVAPSMPPAAPVAGLAATVGFSAHSLISVLVIDIRDYTVLSRELGEAAISALMTEIFRAAGELLFAKGSWSQKYIGDAVMAIWVHGTAGLTRGEFATVLDAVAELKLVLDQSARRLGRPLAFGAAINTGFAQIGNMGSVAVTDYTALGDTVNKAFRLEAACKTLGRDLVVGRSSLDYLQPPVPVAQRPPLVEIALKGYDAPEPVHAFTFAEMPALAALVAG